MSEDHPLNLLSPYGLSTYLGELIVNYFKKLYKLYYATLRFFNVYNPRQSNVYARVILSKALKISRYNLRRWKQTKDFIHVKDVAETIHRANR
uniref:NAD-dependent epimerase/dehydratase family protein n=1 Tax=Ignisphaera aggregans TaxID=334771 RepID=A0A7C4JKI0_9CREN